MSPARTFGPALARRGYALGMSNRRAHALGLACTIVLGIITVVTAADRSQHRFHGHGETKLDIARATVTKYAYEAYPSWAAAHPDARCPTGLAELNEWMNNEHIGDPWGTDYRFRCRSISGVTTMAVISAGPDEEFGTGDDIRSDR